LWAKKWKQRISTKKCCPYGQNKMKIYKIMIRPVITYSSEAWTLTANDTNQKATRLETYGNQTSRKTKTTMARRCHGRSKKAESQKLEGGS
jgi:hypothetical protein